MGFIEKKIHSITKNVISINDFQKIEGAFEPVSNNDYWVYKSIHMQKEHLKKNLNGFELSPKIILYQSQSTESLTKIFGEPSFPQYNDYIYDIWVVSQKNTKFLIKQSSEVTTYDIYIEDATTIFNDQKVGLDIENFMNVLLKVYTK